MRARAIVLGPDGRHVELGHGDVIGRLGWCALAIDDGRISEAHALVSLRGDALQLLALRGRFAVDGRAVSQVALEPGLVVSLADELSLEVVEVVLPDEVLALSFDGQQAQVLLGTTSILVGPPVTLRGGWDARADAWVWSGSEPGDAEGGDAGWRVRRAGHQDAEPVRVGQSFELPRGGGLGPIRIAAVAVPLNSAAATPTVVEGSIKAPLTIVARFQTTHILRASSEVLVLDGAMGRVVSELVALNGPTSWEVVAREVWGAEPPETLLRGRWDATLSRLRARLRSAGVRPDLVRSDRQGHVELVLGPLDKAIDET